MARTFFTADTHFGADWMRLYENRPFPDTASMDEAMIRYWNETVAPEDTVWHLGDLGAEGREAELLSRLHGVKLLVRGNHDTESNAYYREAGFAEVYDRPVILDSFWMLSHEPLYVNANMPYANLFGHVHASPIVRDFSSQHYCVCVERCRYRPVSFEEIRSSMASLTTVTDTVR